MGPSAAIVRREEFETVGGFSGAQFVGDSDLWLKLAARWPVVSLPPALVWWRRHEGQQMSLEQTKPEVLNSRYRLECHHLEGTRLLDEATRQLAFARLKRRHGRRLLSFAVRERKPLAAMRLWRDIGFSVADFFRVSVGRDPFSIVHRTVSAGKISD